MSGIFDQNDRLTPLEKCQVFDHSEMTFLSSKKTHLRKQHHQTKNRGLFYRKKRLERNLEYLTRIIG